MGEMATVPYLFGIAHPTGFPLFVILGWFVSHALPFGTVAWRTTLVACAGGAAAALAVWLALDALGCAPLYATGAAWWFAFGDIVWQHADRTDVHALELGFETLALAFAIRFYRKGNQRNAIAAALASGCALATHPNALWLLPGVLVLLVARRSAPWEKLGIAAALPLLTYLYIPVRSAYLAAHRVDPTLRVGVPPGQPFWNYGDPHNAAGFWWLVSGAQYPTHGAFVAMFTPMQYVRGMALFAPAASADHGVILLVLAAAGWFVLARRAPIVAAALLVCFLGWCAFAAAYQTMENDPPRYLLSALWIQTVCIGALWLLVPRARIARWTIIAIALVAGASCLWSDRGRFLERGDPLAAPFIARIEHETGAHDVIVAQWNYATPLGYAKYVSATLGDRIVVNGGPPENDALIAALAAKYPTDIVLEHPVSIPGVELRSRGRGFPALFSVRPRRAAAGAASVGRR